MELSAQVLCGLEALGALQEETFQTILERSLQAAIQAEGKGEVVSIATDPSNCLPYMHRLAWTGRWCVQGDYLCSLHIIPGVSSC